MKTFIIGDIHGQAGALAALLKKLRPDPRQDWLVFLGDLFDRGPDSFSVFQEIRRLAGLYGSRFVLLRGNHEDYLLSEKLTLQTRFVWERVGRGATVKSFRAHGARMEDAAPWLKERCRLFWKSEEQGGTSPVFQCVHAGLMVHPPEANDTQTLVHDHGVVLQNHYDGPLTVVGHIALEKPTWFAGDGETLKTLEWGRCASLPEKGVLCIDTGCGKGGRLTGMVVDGGDFQLECVAEKE